MSTDIATLGLAIDSRPVLQARDALDSFSGAAKGAETAARNVGAAGSGTSKAAQAVAADFNRMGTSARSVSFEARNLGFQLVDVTQGLVSGQPAFMIFAQQAGQIGQIIATSPRGLGGLMRELGSSIKSTVGTTGLLVGGFAAVGVAGAAIVNSIAKSAMALDDLSRAAGTTNAQMRGLESAAAFKGISTAEFTKGVSQFAGSVYDAQHNMGGLAQVFAANNKSAKSFNDYLEKAADLIERSASDQQRLQILQQMGLPPTMQWVRLLSQGADGIRAAVAESAKFDEVANDKLIANARKFDEAWATAWKNFSTNGQSAIVTAIDSMDRLYNSVDRIAKRIGNSSFWSNFIPADLKGTGVEPLTMGDLANGRVQGGFAAMRENPVNTSLQRALQDRANQIRSGGTLDYNAQMRAIAMQQQYLGILGQTVTADQAVRAVELQIQQYRLQPGALAISQQQVDTLKRLAREQATGVAQIKAMTDAQNVETATIGMSVGAAVEYTAAQNALNAAKQKGMILTAADIASIRANAAALGAAAANADLMRWAYTSLVQGPMQTFQQQLANGASFFDALKAAGINALNSIASKLMDMAAQNLWKNAIGGGSGGGLFSMLFSGGGAAATAGADGLAAIHHTGYGPGDVAGANRYVHPAYFDDAPRFHSGIGPGERAAIIRNDESVLTPGQMRALAPVGGGSAPQDVHVTVSVDNNGNLQAFVEKTAQQATQQGINGLVTSPQFPALVGGASKRAATLRKL